MIADQSKSTAPNRSQSHDAAPAFYTGRVAISTEPVTVSGVLAELRKHVATEAHAGNAAGAAALQSFLDLIEKRVDTDTTGKVLIALCPSCGKGSFKKEGGGT